jgi:SAM-dependent methyltransferase
MTNDNLPRVTYSNIGARASGTEGYAEDADKLAVSYESLTFEGVQREVLHLIPTAPSRVLDVGAGTGRDAAALAAKGHTVTAMEPTAELRAHGQRLHASRNIVWVDDSLPELTRLRAAGQPFDLVMATAVWMHLDDAQRVAAMRNVAALIARGGRLTLSLRHGPVPPGRRMFDVGGDETVALARDNGLSLIHRSERGDMFNRPSVTWTFLGFEKTEAT